MLKINKKIKVIILIVMFLLMGNGYAYLTTYMTIEGRINIGCGQWDLFFTNPVVTDVSETTTFPSNSNGNKPTSVKGMSIQEVDFQVIFNQPGDYYDFDIDLKNNGGIPAYVYYNSSNSRVIVEIEDGPIIDSKMDSIGAYLPSYLKYKDTDDNTNIYIKPGEIEKHHIHLGLNEYLRQSESDEIIGKKINVRIQYFLNSSSSSYDCE
jgi:hypothetical protein